MLAVVGCVGGPSADRTEPTPTAETPTAESPTPAPECVPSTATVVAYETLSDTQQHAFADALLGSSLTMIEGDAWGTPTESYQFSTVVASWPVAGFELDRDLSENTAAYVRRNGTLYRVTFRGPGYARGTTLRMSSIASPDNRTVITLGNRSSDGWEFVEHTIEQGGIASGFVDEIPVERGDVVAYRGQYYEVGVTSIVDFNRWSMDVYEQVC
jgi:hypothetical protein